MGKKKKRYDDVDKMEYIKNVFISQPMRGKTDEEIERKRESAIKRLENYMGRSVEIVNRDFRTNKVPPDTLTTKDAKSLWYLGNSIQKLAQADAIYLVKGHEKNPGCLIERECAMEYGISLIMDPLYNGDIDKLLF